MRYSLLGSLSVLLLVATAASAAYGQEQVVDSSSEIDFYPTASSDSLNLRGRSLGDYRRFFDPNRTNLDASAFTQQAEDDRVETVYRHPHANLEAPAFFAPNGQLDEDVRMDYRLSD